VQIVRSCEELANARGQMASSLAFVPTMGGLHAGHMALVAEGKQRADQVAASIFVNPMQFGANEDFARYPRREGEDAKMLEAAGCDLLWLPSVGDIYPESFSTRVSVAGASQLWEGAARPGHFDGVATVVAKLLIAVGPDIALFGEKDFQQLIVIRRMVEDLAIPVQIIAVPTLREEDGLALSSRNAFLSEDERQRAVALPKALDYARGAILGGAPLNLVLDTARKMLVEAGFTRIDYFALVDGLTLQPLDRPQGEMRLIAAAAMGATRLIDNVAVSNVVESR
jgi:pantoate--beta-alanine ligase